MKNLKLGFTLAEVLITLAIIGVVAALTLPTLITNHKNKVRMTKLQQTYAIISQALHLAQAEHGSLSHWDYSADNTNLDNKKAFVEKYLIKYFNTSNVCGTTPNLGCWQAEMPKMLDGKRDWPYGAIDSGIAYKFVLSNDVAISIDYTQNCVEKHTYCICFSVNVDRHSKNPIIGRTIFYFDAYPFMDNVFPRGIYEHGVHSGVITSKDDGGWVEKTEEALLNNCNAQNGVGDWCAARVVKDGYKMNY